jgi:alkyldihydroxyacetonephosphate synthase
VLRIRPTPEVKRYGSILFPDLELGIKFMEDMAHARLWPASCRLLDNMQFKFGQALKVENESKVNEIIDQIKKFYVLNVKGFNQDKMCAVTLLYEGRKEETSIQERNAISIAKKYGGMNAGEENGMRGYFLTFMIAYIRDFIMGKYYIAESMETSCPWSKVSSSISKCKEKIHELCRLKGVKEEYVFSSFRVTQLYETGAAIYIYIGFNFYPKTVREAVQIFEEVEEGARVVLM